MVLHSSLFSVLSDQLISGSLITSRDSILERPSNLQADQLIVQYIWQDIKVSSDHHSANHQLILNSNVSSYLLITKPSFIARQRKHSRKRRKKIVISMQILIYKLKQYFSLQHIFHVEYQFIVVQQNHKFINRENMNVQWKFECMNKSRFTVFLTSECTMTGQTTMFHFYLIFYQNFL